MFITVTIIIILLLFLYRVRSATPQVVALLLEFGSEVNRGAQINGVHGVTALHLVLHTLNHTLNSRIFGSENIGDVSNSKIGNSKMKNSGIKSWVKTVQLLINSGIILYYIMLCYVI